MSQRRGLPNLMSMSILLAPYCQHRAPSASTSPEGFPNALFVRNDRKPDGLEPKTNGSLLDLFVVLADQGGTEHDSCHQYTTDSQPSKSSRHREQAEQTTGKPNFAANLKISRCFYKPAATAARPKRPQRRLENA